MKRLFAAIVLAIALASWLAGCQRELTHEDGAALLGEISTARVNTAVKGTVTTYIMAGGKKVNAEARIHRGAGRMQMEFVSGKPAGSKIFQQGGFVWQIAPDGKAVRRLPHNPVDQMPGFGDGAVVAVTSGQRVAGRKTQRVIFSPGAKSGARLEMLVDSETKFPLVSEKYNHAGALVARTAFSQVEFGVEPPTEMKLPKAEEGRKWLAEATKIDIARAKEILNGDPVEPKYTPAGMKNTGYYLHKRDLLNGVESRYSDGVRLLSVITFRRPERADTRPAMGQNVSGANTVRNENAARGGNQSVQGWLDQNQQLRERWDAATPEQREKIRETWLERRRQMQGKRGLNGNGRPERGGSLAGAGQRSPVGTTSGTGRPGRDGRGMGEGIHTSRVHGRVARLRVGKFIVVVHGDLPTEELQKIVDSIREESTDF